jgi:acetyl/propionyl-CoA carboxylase alpha subunit
MRRALQEFQLVGVATNLPLVQRLLEQPYFLRGSYSTEFLLNPSSDEQESPQNFRDLAVAVAIVYMRRNQAFLPSIPDRLVSGWHRDSRRLPR